MTNIKKNKLEETHVQVNLLNSTKIVLVYYGIFTMLGGSDLDGLIKSSSFTGPLTFHVI